MSIIFVCIGLISFLNFIRVIFLNCIGLKQTLKFVAVMEGVNYDPFQKKCKVVG